MRRLEDTRQKQIQGKDRTMEKAIEVGGWYYRMMGYGGSDSQYCCVVRGTGERTGANLYSLFGGVGGSLKKLPVAEVFLAVDEKGREFKVSANDLAANGHIGIGTLEEVEFPHRATIFRDDARLLVEKGRYTEAEIAAEFPYAFMDFDEVEDRMAASPLSESLPMTEGQEAILRAAREANEEKAREEAEAEARKFAAEVEEARRRFSYIPCPKTEGKWLRTGEVSRNLRAVLAHEFPGVKFAVRSSRFSGGDSATVTWTDGPTRAAVDRIVDAFQGKRPDYTGDYWDDVATAVTVVCGDFSYTHADRRYTDGTRKYVEEFIDGKWPRSGYDGDGYRRQKDVDRQVGELLARTEFPAGGYEIEGIEWDEAKCEWFMKFKAKGEPTPPTDGGDGSDGVARMTENEEKRGLEVWFPSVPSAAVREGLKRSGFRWHKARKVWYARKSPAAEEAAARAVAEFNGTRAAA